MERLLCLEEVDCVQPTPKRAFRHETLLNDERVLRNLLAKEDAYMPSGSYFVFQEEIRPYMRTVLTKWMMDVRTPWLFILYRENVGTPAQSMARMACVYSSVREIVLSQ